MKTGLVIEGGGSRGIYAAGVLDALMGENIFFDGVAGVSAGAMLNMGYGKCVVILTQPSGFRKKASAVLPLIRFFYRKYPEFVHAMETRHLRYNQTLDRIAELEKAERLFVFRPSRTVPVSRTESDPAKLHALYQVGLEDGLSRIKSGIHTFLKVQ